MVEVLSHAGSDLVKSGYIRTVGVVGAGQMGHGIAQVMAHKAGIDVIVQDVSPTALDKAKTGISKSLEKFVSKGQLTEAAMAEAIGRIRFETTLDAFTDVDLVVSGGPGTVTVQVFLRL